MHSELIKNCIFLGDFDATTRMVLISAIFFKGKWLQPFFKEKTIKMDFWRTQSQKVKKPFMTQWKKFPYAKLVDLDAKLLELPYEVNSLI